MKNIAKTLKERLQWVNFRANCLFPCYINGNNNQIISFQNYWRWKRKVNVKAHLVLRSEDSSIVSQKEFDINSHNEISIKKEFELINFKGMVSVEIYSTENIRFPYPAVTCFYENNKGKLISCVHAASRLLNFNEKVNRTEFSESNFLCRYNENFEPFFFCFSGSFSNHFFNSYKFKIYNDEYKLLLSKKVNLKFEKPFSSRILYLSEIFSKKDLKKVWNKKFFIKIQFNVIGAFGRLIVGNYDKKFDALFTTHTLNSFEELKAKKSFIPKQKSLDANILMSLISNDPLRLEINKYPINDKAKITFNSKISKKPQEVYQKIKNKYQVKSGYGGKIFSQKLDGNKSLLIYANQKTPDRFFVTANYYLKNSRHPTDMAWGFHTSTLKPKFNHWGQSVCKKGFDTYLLIRNTSHNFSKSKNAKCLISVFNNSKKITKKRIVKGNSYDVVKFDNLDEKLKSNYFSWNLRTSNGDLEVLWVAFSENGAICGDHSY
ncbi:MAG: hypothetical protein CMG02_00255 [Candidatus Marinimicrobia bacterium]|mgnify:FL=1|nr:hypothetical protein [Candidatus Neomarinimicrobiota bacterium]|tara:strand:+ start:12985 stop:14454 length:1470 start_codon:yes stop_codon:yes gene_type:complete